MIEEFAANAELPRGFTSYFLAMVPKISNPQRLYDYRSISLLRCLHKILAKLLVFRLRKSLVHIIASNQSAYLPGRNNLDGVAIISEVVDFAKKGKESLSHL